VSKKNNSKKKVGNLFSKKQRSRLRWETKFFVSKKNIFLNKKKASKLSVFENEYFWFCPEKSIIAYRIPPPPLSASPLRYKHTLVRNKGIQEPMSAFQKEKGQTHTKQQVQ
jgi:hypothetical protein